MNYIEVRLPFSEDPVEGEILIAQLAELGFESFSEEEEGYLLAYIPQKDFSKEALDSIDFSVEVKKRMKVQLMEETNWNEVWESNYDSVTIGGKCHVRAPFHPENKKVEFDIVLNPKMAFGTAHHETTALMIEFLMEENVAEQRVLDMGCGTAVLAILASMKGATEIDAIDNDEWAYRNSIENISLNDCPNVQIILGDAAFLKEVTPYQVIFANINRNILIRDVQEYAKVLKENGLLFLSGFYNEDREMIREAALKNGLHFVESRTQNNWVAAKFELTH